MNILPWDILTIPGLTVEETLQKLYTQDKLSVKQIADKLGITQKPLIKKLKELKIQTRPQHRRSVYKDRIEKYLLDNPEISRPCDLARKLDIPYQAALYYKHLLKEQEKV